MPSETIQYETVAGVLTGYEVFDDVVSEKPERAVSYGPGGMSRVSVNTPGFYKSFRSGKKNVKPVDLPMNGFTFNKVFSQHEDSTMTYRSVQKNPPKTYIDVTSGLMIEDFVIPDHSTSDSVTLSKKAQSRLLTGLKDQSVNVAVAVAEGRKTLDTIAETAVNLAKAGSAVRRFDFGGAARALGVVFTKRAKKHMRESNSLEKNWLALQYGWLPLLSDIYGMAEFVAKTQNYHPREKQTSSASTSGSYQNTFKNGGWVVTDRWQLKHTVKCVVYFSEQGGGNPPTALGLTNPLAVAWELVPFSFVVDWFLPVGTFLNNLDATLGLTFVKGCQTEFRQLVSTRHVGGSSSTDSGGNTVSYEARHTSTHTETFCERKPFSGFPLSPVPEFKSPFSGRKGDFRHEVNAMALLIQAFK